MIVYNGIKNEFMKDCKAGVIADKVRDNILIKLGRHTADNEYRSWENSLIQMYVVIDDDAIPGDAGIAIEYNVPQTAKRVDFMISGYDQFEKPNVVIIELKQWDQLGAVEESESLVRTFTGGAPRQVVHPSYQAWSYAQLIMDYNSHVQDKNVLLHPCAYLHNYKRFEQDPLDYTQYKDYLDEAPAYSKGQGNLLCRFIKQFIRFGDRKEILYDIDNGKIRPSKRLQDAILGMVKGNQEFIMIDEQRIAYEGILRTVHSCQNDGKKRTVIVQGGPGTGKTVIAINLLANLTGEGIVAQYVTKTTAPRDVYKAKLKGYKKKSYIDNLFKGSGCYIGVDKNAAGVLIADEAHRLRKKNQYDHGENQIKEIINAALCSIFFIDESQRVTMEDIGSIDEIQHWADYYQSEVTYFELLSQFRCNGSNGYLAWLDDVLQIRETANYSLEGLDYDFKVFDSATELYEAIKEKNSCNNQARLVAGYCWNWNKNEVNNTDFHDIQIGDFRMSWNLGKGVYALEDTSINEVGCIHTTQGLEFDYIGVIIGKDLQYANGSLVTDFRERADTDKSVSGLKKLEKQDPEEARKKADEIIKNTYRTLMSRGMKGCYIYCCDENLNDYFKQRLDLR